jgi:hypothetical protein
VVKAKIITCPAWGARQPKRPATLVGKSRRIIFHHTDGHHPEIENPTNESVAEAIRYAQDIQAFHMGRRSAGEAGTTAATTSSCAGTA